jgi:branched-chain amino acid transport system substrate-binding protein
MDDTVVYNRGLLQAAVQVQALTNAVKIAGGQKPTTEQVKQGMEQIKDFALGGLVPPLTITATDHEGGGWVKVFGVHDGKFVQETDWLHPYRDVVENAVKTAE